MRKPVKGEPMRRFYFHQRGGIYYVELVDPKTGTRLTAKSTGTRDRDTALLKVAEWLEKGIPTGPKGKPRSVENHFTIHYLIDATRKADIDSEGAEAIVKVLQDRGLIVGSFAKPGPGTVPFLDFLYETWNPERSPRLREKNVYGQSVTMRHIGESTRLIARYWDVPELKNLSLIDVTRDHIKARLLELRQTGLTAGTVNKALVAVATPLAWATREGLIPHNPAEGVPRFSGAVEKRDVFTPEEAARVLSAHWKEHRARVGNLLAATTGLRAGEVLAVRRSDIGESILEVRHSWSDYDGLKSPKNGEARRVPLLPEVRAELLALLEENQHLCADPYCFYSVLPTRPMDQKHLITGLREAAEDAGIEIGNRNIVFHSWRHYYAARMSDRMAADQIQRITGHRSRAVFDAYSDHINQENLEAVGKVGAEVFGNILQFPREA